LTGDEIKERIDHLTDGDATRLRETVESTEDIVHETTENLEKQTNKLKDISKQGDKIEVIVDGAKYDSSKLKCCGCWYRLFHKRAPEDSETNAAPQDKPAKRPVENKALNDDYI